jgi:phage repressor protein C with HTH and peptisase S24 domain
MLPTLRPDQLVLGIGNKRNLKKGDVVIAIYEGREIIKRIADTKGKLIFLVGDNKIASTDSRYIGWFDTKNISNKIIWPKT